MKKVKDYLWVLKPSLEEAEGLQPEPAPAPEQKRKRKREQKGEANEVAVKVVVTKFGGAICYDSTGLLLTTATAIISEFTPNNKLGFAEALKKVKVRARCCGGLFRDAVFYGENQGLVAYQIPKIEDDEVFHSINLNDININNELTALGRVFAFVQTGGNFSFRSGISNTTHPRVLEVVVNKKNFPYLNPRLPLLQFSNLGKYMSSGMSGCAVFKEGETNHHFLGLIVICIEQFSLVIPLSTIRDVLPNIRQEEGKDEDTSKTMKKGGGDGGKGGRDDGSGGWQGKGGGGGRGKGGGGWQGKGVGGGRGKGGGGWQGKGGGSGRGKGGGDRGGKGIGGRVREGIGGGGGGVVYGINMLSQELNKPEMQNVPPARLVRFLREHRSEFDAYSVAALKANLYAFPGIQAMRFIGSQIIMHLGVTIEHEEDNPTNRTLDLTSSPEVGPPTNQGASDATFFGSTHSVLTIVFHLPFESNLPESVATMARQYVSSVISSVQRVAMAISPSDLTPTVCPKLSPGSPKALTLVHWICNIYSCPGKGFYRKTQTGGRCNSFMVNLTNRTLDLTLNLEVGSPTNQGASDATTSGSTSSVFTIAFQLLFDSNLQESVATMAHPSALTSTVGPKLSLGSL